MFGLGALVAASAAAASKAFKKPSLFAVESGSKSSSSGGQTSAVGSSSPKPSVVQPTPSSKPQIAPPQGYIPIRETAERLGATVGWDNATKRVSIDGRYMSPNEFVNIGGVTYAKPDVLSGNYLNERLYGPGSSSLGLDANYDRQQAQSSSQFQSNQEAFRNIQSQYGIDSRTGQYVGVQQAPGLQQEIAPLGSLAQIDQLRQQLVAPVLQEAATGRAEVQAGSLLMMNKTIDMIDQLEQQMAARMQEMLGGVDEATMWALRGIRNSIQEQRDALTNEMNRRGLLQSGIWLEMEDRLNKNQLDQESQVRLARISELQNMLWNSLNNFANQRVNAIAQYGRDYVAAIDQEYQNRINAWGTATGQAMDWTLNQQQLAQNQNQFVANLGLEQQRLTQGQNQFNAQLAENQRQFNERMAQEQKQWQAEYNLSKQRASSSSSGSSVTKPSTLTKNQEFSFVQENISDLNEAVKNGIIKTRDQANAALAPYRPYLSKEAQQALDNEINRLFPQKSSTAGTNKPKLVIDNTSKTGQLVNQAITKIQTDPYWYINEVLDKYK